jgi:glycosyltransferase involved in cell wall biosynthesis
MVNASSDRLRILHLFYEPHFSGVSRHVLWLLEWLDSAKHEMWVLAASPDPRVEEAFTRILGPDRTVIVPGARFFSLRGAIRAAGLIRRERIDILHIHNLQSLLWGFAASLHCPDLRIVFTPQVIEVGNPGVMGMVHGLLRLLKARIDRFVAVSDSQASLVSKLGLCNPDSLSVVYNRIASDASQTVDSGPPADRTLERIGVEADTVVVCQVGRLVAQKNPLFLIKAAEIALKEFPNMLFLLVGEGPLKRRLQDQVERLGLSDKIHLMGFREDSNRIMMASDIVSLTSRWEGLPYALIEALRCRKPLVATNVTGNRDLVVDGKTGYLVETEEDLADRLIRLASSRQAREEMGMEGYRRYRHLFDPRKMAEEMAAVYASGTMLT